MKKILILAIAVLLALSAPLCVSAQEANVTYSGNSGEFIFKPGGEESPTDLFPEFKDVMPGDTINQKITVKNDADNKVKVKIYIRALGAHEDSRDFLSMLNLRVAKSVDNTMEYMFDAAASLPAQLGDWTELGTLYSGGVVNLDVYLDVPITLDNNYTNKIGLLAWEFKVEEYPTEEGDPKPPQTSDSFNIKLWLIILIGSAAVLFVLMLWRKNKKSNA